MPGLNITEAPNEWGKSTWCAFLTAMLYGISTSEKTSAKKLADKERYAPWSGLPMSGTMEIEWNGKKITLQRSIWGENPIDIWKFTDSDVLVTLGFIGCPACAGNLDLFHAMGISKVMFCGGGGVLDRNIQVGQLLLVEGAIRDEGFSHHYLPPSRTVEADPAVTDAIARYLDGEGIPYLRDITWTTDAIFRETADRIARRKEEGAKIVEMEQAGCLAVAKFRGFSYGALIYGGDDVSGEEWSGRSWQSRKGVRYDLVQLCKRLTEVI